MKHLPFHKRKSKGENAYQAPQDISDYVYWLAPGAPEPSEYCSGRNERRKRRTHLDTGLCLVVMCQFITFCDSASCLLQAVPLFVQLASSIEGNVGYINTCDDLTRSLWDCSNARHVLKTALLLTVEELQE